MMGLVAYDNSGSDISEDEDEIERKNESKNNGEVKIATEHNHENAASSNIFKSLPQPQLNTNESVIEEDDEFLKKNEVPTEKAKKQPIKISVPSLADFDSDDEETPVKKAKVVNKSSGLFALLPPPKGTSITTKHFVPNAVKKNINKKTQPTKKVIPPTVKSKDKAENLDGEDEEDSMKDVPDTFDDEIWQKVCGRKEKRTPRPIIEEPIKTDIVQSNPEVTKPYDGLDNQAFKELVGGNSKRKGEAAEIDIVEITEDEILSDKKIWMTKSLTDPEMAPKFVVKDPVNDTCKRKHHITYLAQQAKANEQELQNQWAASRFTRQKTQAKYGF